MLDAEAWGTQSTPDEYRRGEKDALLEITLLPRQAASIQVRNLEPQIPPPLDLFSPFNIAFFSSL